MTQQDKADIGVTGLAVMGRNLARNLARHGHVVALHNRSPERTRSLVEEHGDEGTFVPSESMPDFVASLKRPRAIIVMVKAGEPTDAVIRRARAAARRGRHRGQLRQRALHRHPAARGRPAPGRAALRRLRCLRRRGRGAQRAEHHARRVHRVATRSSGRSSSPSPRRSTARHAARMSGQTAPATSSRWCTTASSTPTCSSSPRPMTCCGPVSAPRRARSARSSAPGTRATWIPISSRSPPRCSRTPTRNGPALRGHRARPG